MCFGEWEEQSLWEPFHVERGFNKEDDVVTVFAPLGSHNISDVRSPDPEGVLKTISASLDSPAVRLMRAQDFEYSKSGANTPVLAINPIHAQMLRREGWSKADVKQFIYEQTRRIPIEKYARYDQDGWLEAGRVVDGTVECFAGPEALLLVVAGGPGYTAVLLPAWPLSVTVSKRIEIAKT